MHPIQSIALIALLIIGAGYGGYILAHTTERLSRKTHAPRHGEEI